LLVKLFLARTHNASLSFLFFLYIHPSIALFLAEEKKKKTCSKHTNLIQLDSEKLGPLLAQQLLGSFAVRAITLAEDGDGIVVDDLLRFGFGGRGHGGGYGGAEESGCY